MTTPDGIFLKVLGCRLNQAEGEDWNPARRVNTPAAAELLVLHGCAVTAHTERKARQILYRWRRDYPARRLAVTGCLARHWCRNNSTVDGVELVTEGWPAPSAPDAVAAPLLARRTRRTLKMQDGCSHRCSYCIVPQLRDRAWNIEPAAGFDRIRAWVAEGIKEIVLSGLHLGAYRHVDIGLAAWVNKAIAMPGDFRLRLSSLEPNRVTEELLRVIAENQDRICPHLHLPMQSGAASVLKNMNRPYDRASLSELLRRIRKIMPRAALTADLMVGFPGETDEDFQETMKLVDEYELSRAHVFTFSPRPGTPAADFPNRVAAATARARATELTAHTKRAATRYRERLIGTKQRLLVERPGGRGYTEYYQEVALPGDLPANRFVTVTITGVAGERLRGAVAE